MKNKVKTAFFVIFVFFASGTFAESVLQNYVDDREQQLSKICNSVATVTDCKSGVIKSGPVIFNWLSVWAEEKSAWVSLYSFSRQETPDSPDLKPLTIGSIYKDFAGSKIGWKSLLAKESTDKSKITFQEWSDQQREALKNQDQEQEKRKYENEDAVNKKRQEVFSLLNTLNIETISQIEDKLSTFFPKPGTYDLAPSRVYTAHIQENTLFFAREFTEHRTLLSANGLVFLDANGHAHPAIQQKQVVDSITLSLEKEPSNLGRCFIEERYKNSAFSLDPDTYIDEGNTIIERGTFWNGYYRPEADGLFRVSCLGVRSTPENPGLFEFRQMFFVLDGKAIPLSVSVKPEFKPRQ